jgi:hypothetical protein
VQIKLQNDQCKLQTGVIGAHAVNLHLAFRNLHFAIVGVDHAEAAKRGRSGDGGTCSACVAV